MKICALTMVYRDYWALSRWYAHHGHELGSENLIVVRMGPALGRQPAIPGYDVPRLVNEAVRGIRR